MSKKASAPPPKSNGSVDANVARADSPDDLPPLVYDEEENWTAPSKPVSDDPYAWNLETPIPTDLDTQDEFPDILFPLFDYHKIGRQVAYPKPELRETVLARLAKANALRANGGAADGDKAAKQQQKSQQGLKRSRPESPKSGIAAKELGAPAAKDKSESSCEVELKNPSIFRHSLDFVGDAQCTAIEGGFFITTADRMSPEATLVEICDDQFEVMRAGIFNISQRNATALSRQLDVAPSGEIKLQIQVDCSLTDQPANSKVGASLQVLDLSSDKSLISCDVKITAIPVRDIALPHSMFTTTFGDPNYKKLHLDFYKLATGMAHLSQFGSHVDIEYIRGSSNVLLCVNGAEWSIPSAQSKDTTFGSLSTKNLPITRFLNIFRQSERICGNINLCILTLPGVMLQCRGPNAYIYALVKEERKKKG